MEHTINSFLRITVTI